MKYLLIVSLSLFSLSSLANHHKGGEMNAEWKKKWDAMSFEDAKKMKSEKLSMHKAAIEKAQVCMDKATDKDGLMKCSDEMRKSKKEMKDKMMKKM